MPVYDYLIYSFAKPNLTSSLSGVDNLTEGTEYLIDALQKRGIKVMLAVGGATYNEWAGLAAEQGKDISNTTHKRALKELIDKYGFDGLDVDYEVDTSEAIEYKKSVLAMREVVDSFVDEDKKLSIAGWSTGADCTASFLTGDDNVTDSDGYGKCLQGQTTYWGGRAGRERRLFKLLKNDGKDLEKIFDFVSVMSYDGQVTRFDPVQLHKNYRELYKGPMALGLQTAAEGWTGAELVITHEDAKSCPNTSMLKGSSYTSTVDANASYSMERFANYLTNEDVNDASITSDKKNGFMLWHVTKKRSNFNCSRAVSNEQATSAIGFYLFGDSTNSIDELTSSLGARNEAPAAYSTEPVVAYSDESFVVPAFDEDDKRSYLEIEKAIISNNPLLVKAITSMQTFREFNTTDWPLDNSIPNFEVNATNLPLNVQRVKKVFDEDKWDHVFPLANVTYGGSNAQVEKNLDGTTYTYKNFLNAVAFYPNFCNEAWDDNGVLITDTNELDTVCKKELSAMFAHFAQEVGAHDNTFETSGVTYAPALLENSKLASGDLIPQWRQGLFHVSEYGCSEDIAAGCLYRECNLFGCGDGAKYFGRGAKQLSYNYNYIPFSITVLGDGDILKNDPSLVAKDGRLALLSAFYFYMTSRSPKPSIHHVVAGSWKPNENDITNGRKPGFGVTIDIVNGGVECGGDEDIAQGKNRIRYYLGLRDYFGVPLYDGGTKLDYYTPYKLDIDGVDGTGAGTTHRLGCGGGMKNFADGGSASAPSFWENSWADDGKCKLVSYETKFSAFREGEYADCVRYHFGE